MRMKSSVAIVYQNSNENYTLRTNWSTLVNGFSDYVHDTAKRGPTDGNLKGEKEPSLDIGYAAFSVLRDRVTKAGAGTKS